MLFVAVAVAMFAIAQGNLPRWVGWLGIALALPAVTPVGAITFFGAGIWILLVSALLWTRGRGLSRLETDLQPLGEAA